MVEVHLDIKQVNDAPSSNIVLENMDNEINKKITSLKEKYSLTGQHIEDYLEGLLFANPLNYWKSLKSQLF